MSLTERTQQAAHQLTRHAFPDLLGQERLNGM
jgi:hypothetical protein